MQNKLGWLVALGYLSLASCSLIVGNSIEGTEPACSTSVDCLWGYVCSGGVCEEVAQTDPTLPSSYCGSGGCTVVGPDGVSLTLPQNATFLDILVEIERGSSTAIADGTALVTRPYRLKPENATLLQPGQLSIPVGSSDCPGNRCVMYRLASDGTPTLITTTVAEGGGVLLATSDVTQFGLYAVALPTATGEDGGPEDGPMMEDGAVVEDGGVPVDAALDATVIDANVVDSAVADAARPDTFIPDSSAPDTAPTDAAPIPLFAPCNFVPESCAMGNRCGPDPFNHGEGFCTTSCAEGGADCACCRVLPGFDQPSCLPAELCGTGVIGSTCGSTADCDYRQTSLCQQVGGGSICTVPCNAEDELITCDDGCCVASTSDPDSPTFCEAVGRCYQLELGDRCVTPRGCSSQDCRSYDDASPRRCTEECSYIGGCAPGLCCYPAACPAAAEPMCVPQTVCDGTTELLCDNFCVSDQQCVDWQGAGWACLAGECIPLASCGECFKHEHCQLDEYCFISLEVQALCDNYAEGVPCCGECLSRGDSTCYLPEHCPPPDLPDNRLCHFTPVGEDPYHQQAGECQPLQPGTCLIDDDCDAPEVCVDGECL